MSLKRILPVLLLLTLVISLMACQSNTAEEAAELPADTAVTETEQMADVEKDVPVEGEADEVAVQNDAEPVGVAEAEEEVAIADTPDVAESSAEVAPELANVPEFVPPAPVQLATDPASVAFAMGDPNAPVQIVEFTDYQCPFCQRYAMEIMPSILENLVESGRVFYAIKDLPLAAIHPEAHSASVAARCAGEQDAYLPMHDAIFATQQDWSGAGDEAEVIFTDLASELDLNADTFSTCLVDGQQTENVQANMEEAMAIGVNGTPFFFIDGYGVSGAQPYEMFEMSVELAENSELDDIIEAQAKQAYDAMLAQQAAMAEQEALAAQAPAEPPAPIEVSMENAYAIGNPDAPVTIVEYTDYQCPFCARHALQTFSQIADTMVETGQVRYVFKDLPLAQIHPQATMAAEAARCAGAQNPDAYVAMHDMLFENQQAWSGQANAADLFTNYAEEIGLDSESLATCLDNREYEAAVQADIQEAAQIGFSGTPAFIINGQPLVGAQPFEVFEQAVEYFAAEASVQTANN